MQCWGLIPGATSRNPAKGPLQNFLEVPRIGPGPLQGFLVRKGGQSRLDKKPPAWAEEGTVSKESIGHPLPSNVHEQREGLPIGGHIVPEWKGRDMPARANRKILRGDRCGPNRGKSKGDGVRNPILESLRLNLGE